MKVNKSIDGLSTHSAKKTAATPKLKTNPNKPVRTIKITSPDPEENDFLKPVQAFDFSSDTGELTAVEEPKQDVKSETTTYEETMKKTEDEVKDSKKTAKKPQKSSQKPQKTRKIVTTILLIIVLVLIALIAWAVFWGNDIIAKITGGQGNVLDLISLMDETYEPLKTDANGRTNILAFGTSGFDMNGDVGDGTHDGSQLTDSIMMISLNQETGDVVMLSLPRDLKVPGACYAGKINEVYLCNNQNGNDENSGATALMEAVGDVLGVNFQYYAHLNWGSLVSIVDTLGGITIVLDEDIADYGWTDAVYEAGVEYTINGEEALGLARARHGTMGGDFTRGTSQQKILIGIKNRIFEKNLSLTDMLSLASTLGDNLRTNLSLQELKTLAHLTFEFDFDTIRQITLIDYINGIYYMTTATIDGISYVIPSAGDGNYAEIQNYVHEQLLWTPPVETEESENTENTETIEETAENVEVLE